MLLQRLSVLLSFAIHASAAAYHRQSPVKPYDACPSSPGAAHIIGIRGTLEEQGFGELKKVVDRLMEALPGSDAVPISYPAGGITIPEGGGEPQYDLGDYIASESEGYIALVTEIKTFVDRCPETDIVLLGYSQGAHVVGDVLCGARKLIFPYKAPLDTSYSYSIRAIIQLGDPTNRGDISWHVGNATHSGIFPRLDLTQCRRYGDLWQSYCDADDFFCDRGDSIPVHLTYVQNHGDEIVKFVTDQVKEERTRFSRPCLHNDLRI